MSAAPAADADAVRLRVGTQDFIGWKRVSVTRSCETMPNSFTVTASAEHFQGAAIAGTRSGQPCEIYAGDDLLITGWIDQRRIRIAEGHDVVISGRGITRNLVDCSVDLLKDPRIKNGMLTAASTLDLAQRLANAFNITVKSAAAEAGPPIPYFQVLLGETPYSVIECVARYAGFILYEDEHGAMVLDQISKQAMASGFALPGNIESIDATRSVDQRYSDYVVVWYGISQLAEGGSLTNLRAEVTDPTLGEYRPRIIVSEQIAPPMIPGAPVPDVNWMAKRRANWELARRRGRSQAASISVPSWRDSAGALWRPNRLVTLDAPAADIVNAHWTIGTVTYRQDESGTHADLVLMPPDAFDPEPAVLQLFDAELAAETIASGSGAAPPT